MAGDELSGYLCPHKVSEDAANPPKRSEYGRCDSDCLDARGCPVLPVYRENIKLRADMRKLRAAVLGDMTPEEAEQKYRRFAEWEIVINAQTHGPSTSHFSALADVVAKL